MNNENHLVEIPKEKWRELRDLFQPNWPENILGYSTIDTYCRWDEKDSNIKNLVIYSLNGDWSDGTYLVIDRYQLFIYTLNKSLDRLKTALSLLDWSNGYKVSSFSSKHHPAIEWIVETKNLETEYDSLTYLYYFPKEDAQEIEVNPPKGITLKEMKPEHAKIANDVWPNKHEGSLFFLKRLIDLSPNIGAFTDDGTLVSWCFRLQAGPLGALQTSESHFRQGLGSLVVKEMIHKMADLDLDTFALVGFANTASQKMFEKIGFKKIQEVYWFRNYPANPDYTWKD